MTDLQFVINNGCTTFKILESLELLRILMKFSKFARARLAVVLKTGFTHSAVVKCKQIRKCVKNKNRTDKCVAKYCD